MELFWNCAWLITIKQFNEKCQFFFTVISNFCTWKKHQTNSFIFCIYVVAAAAAAAAATLKQIWNKFIFYIPKPFHCPKELSSNSIYLLLNSQFPVDDFLVNFCAMIFTWTDTHTLAVFWGQQNIFRWQNFRSNSNSIVSSIWWNISNDFPFVIELSCDSVCYLLISYTLPNKSLGTMQNLLFLRFGAFFTRSVWKKWKYILELKWLRRRLCPKLRDFLWFIVT